MIFSLKPTILQLKNDDRAPVANFSWLFPGPWKPKSDPRGPNDPSRLRVKVFEASGQLESLDIRWYKPYIYDIHHECSD